MTTPERIQRGLKFFAEAQKLQAAGQLAEAAVAYNRALADIPKHPSVLEAFARLTAQVKDWKNAETLWRRLAAIRPEPQVRLHLATVLGQQGKHLEVLDTLAALPDEIPGADIAVVRATALAHLGRWEESLEHAGRSWRRHKNASAVASMVIALYVQARVEEIDPLVKEALALYPDHWLIRALYALHALKSFQNLGRAFSFYPDVRRNTVAETPRYDTDDAGLPWDGKPFPGILRVVTDAGIGDQVLAASMFADLEHTGLSVQVLCEERLLPVFRRSFPALEFIARTREGQAVALATLDPRRDRRANAPDIAQFFRAHPEDFPQRPAWLRIDTTRRDALAAKYRARWPGRRLVGISWHSSRILEGGAPKGLPLAGLAPLLQRDDCVFISLQYGDVQAEIDALREDQGITVERDSAIDATGDIDGLLAQIAALDAVVTTSNTTAHLAGAIGAHCLVLLPSPHPVLWYWGYRGERTAWYPSIRLLRCPEPGGWPALVAQLAATPALLDRETAAGADEVRGDPGNPG